MLKYIALMTMGVFGAASMAVAGTPITTITTTMPRLHRLERPVVHAKKPNLIPKVPRVGTNMRVHDQQSGTQPRIRGLPGHRGMVSTGRRARLQLPPPRLRVIRESSKTDYKCANLKKLLTVSETIYNDGGPLAAHRATAYVKEFGGAELFSAGIPIPPMAHGQQVAVKIPVSVMKSRVGKLPGTHMLSVYLMVNGKRTVSGWGVAFPQDYCQPKTGSITHGNMPDLIPQVSNPLNGIINVKNIGGATAGASKLTVNCKNLGGGPGSDCPSTPALDSLHSNASGALVMPVPALAAGQSYKISLPVQGLKWSKGNYRFTYKADATHAVAESNESNNKIVMTMNMLGTLHGKPVSNGNMPDLIPQVSNPFNGIIKVKNIGGATAGASKLTVNCEKVGGGFVAAGGDCPSTPALDSIPSDASGALLESVPALHAGQVYTIALPVQGLKWAKGKYRFTYKADATHAVTESNESNNVENVVRQR